MFPMGDIEKTPGDRLREIRENLKLSLREAAKRGEKQITHSHIGKIEKGEQAWSNVGYPVITALARAYEMSPEKLISKAEGRDRRLTKRHSIDHPQRRSTDLRNPTPVGRLVQLQFLGNVSAGLGGDGSAIDDVVYEAVLENYLEDSDPDNCFLLRVNGDSMACEDARKDIPEGVTIIVDGSIRPENGDIVVCELINGGDRVGVLKVYRPNEKFTVLESYNEKHKDIILQGDMRAELKGVYINHIPPGRRRRRKP